MRKKRERIGLSQADKAFMTTLYEQQINVAYHTALRISNDKQITWDLTQECFENLIKNISTLRTLECCKIDAYIVIVIRRLYYNYAKKESKMTLLPIDQPSVAAEVDEMIAEKKREHSASRLTLTTLLEQLQERDRRILESYYIEGLPDETLAEEFQCKVDSVRALRSRACKRAKAIGLRSEEGDETEHG